MYYKFTLFHKGNGKDDCRARARAKSGHAQYCRVWTCHAFEADFQRCTWNSGLLPIWLASTRHELDSPLRPSVRIVLLFESFPTRGSEQSISVSVSLGGIPDTASISKNSIAAVYRRVYFDNSKFPWLWGLPGRPIPRESAVQEYESKRSVWGMDELGFHTYYSINSSARLA